MTVTVGTSQGQNPATYPCDTGSETINIVVSTGTVDLVGETDLDTYLQARTLLVTGDSSGATALITPLANGSTDSPNWAQQWLYQNIPS